MCFPSRICLVVTIYKYLKLSTFLRFHYPLLMLLQFSRRPSIRKTHLPWQSGLAIFSCLAFSYSCMSNDITVFFSGPTSTALIFCACLIAVISVFHSCGGSAKRGCVSTTVKGLLHPVIELYATQFGMSLDKEWSAPWPTVVGFFSWRTAPDTSQAKTFRLNGLWIEASSSGVNF